MGKFRNFYKEGWRPAVGWVCVLALFSYYVPYCLATTALWCFVAATTQTLPDRPDLNFADLLGLLGALLGVSVPRTWERLKGVEPKDSGDSEK
jgi:hypothetical protein